MLKAQILSAAAVIAVLFSSAVNAQQKPNAGAPQQPKHGYDVNVTAHGNGGATVTAGTTHSVTPNTQVYTNTQVVVPNNGTPQVTGATVGIRGTF